jgi:hypothetical protein
MTPGSLTSKKLDFSKNNWLQSPKHPFYYQLMVALTKAVLDIIKLFIVSVLASRGRKGDKPRTKERKEWSN